MPWINRVTMSSRSWEINIQTLYLTQARVHKCLWYEPIKTFYKNGESHLFICVPLLKENCNILYIKPAFTLDVFIAFQSNPAKDIHLTFHLKACTECNHSNRTIIWFAFSYVWVTVCSISEEMIRPTQVRGITCAIYGT